MALTFAISQIIFQNSSFNPSDFDATANSKLCLPAAGDCITIFGGAKRIYAVGDCVNFAGPKMGHMAVNQAQVAAANVAAEIAGHDPITHYDHDMMLVLDVADGDSISFHKDLWLDDPSSVRHSRFWSWAKRVHKNYGEATHA
jgi:hypothetical protein